MAGVPFVLARARLARPSIVLLAVAMLSVSTQAQSTQAQSTQVHSTPADKVVEVRVVGNETIPTAKVMAQLQTRAGRDFDEHLVQRDVRKLATLGWFVDVEPLYRQAPGGRIVVFRVVERPTLRYVKYLGNKKIKDKTLAKETGLAVGDSVDPYAVEEGRRKIEELYHSRGFNKARVTLFEGNRANDRGAVYVINEGQVQRVWKVDFVGNTIVSDARLRKAVVKSKPGWFRIYKGYVDPRKIDQDVDRITAYYRSLGYFRAEVGRELQFSENDDWLTLTFVIREGPRYKVRNVSFLGNKRILSEALASQLRLKSGQYFNQSAMNTDVNTLRDLYGSQGHVFASVQAHPRFLGIDQPGMLDLVYNIDEGERYRVGRIIVHIGGEHPHTRTQAVLNRISLRPGDLIDITKIRKDERRLRASQLFAVDAARGVVPKIVFSPPEFDDTEVADHNHAGSFRGQSPDPAGHHPRWHTTRRPPSGQQLDVHLVYDAAPTEREAQPLPPPIPIDPCQKLLIRYQSPPNSLWQNPPTRQPVPYKPVQYGGQAVGNLGPGMQPPSARLSQQNSTIAPYTQPPDPWSGYSQAPGAIVAPPAAAMPPPGYAPQRAPVPLFSSPNMPVAPAVNPLASGNPFQTYPDPYDGQLADPRIPLVIELEETTTGRFMVGVGINSDAGVIGSVVIDERNFDWRRFPTSFEDLPTAFKGNGERFRLEALPGTEVQRYMINFQNPYLFDTRISLGLSGFFFDRRYRDWDEQRVGGRVSLGYQLAPDLSTTFAYRGENVQILDPRIPTPTQLAAVVGDNVLHGFQGTLTHDTRDSAFLATSGHFIELSFEQVVGDFNYPKSEIDVRQYFLLRERPDGSGRHVISVSTRLGFAGDNTPVYDHFFAGGFSTLRGFDFRGASPVQLGTTVGGEFLWVNSVEYLLPVTADDMLRAVIFCDFGTVEPNVNINDFRVVPGVGLRVTVPALGPAPIALDFGFPVVKAAFDDRRVFSFNIGYFR